MEISVIDLCRIGLSVYLIKMLRVWLRMFEIDIFFGWSFQPYDFRDYFWMFNYRNWKEFGLL